MSDDRLLRLVRGEITAAEYVAQVNAEVRLARFSDRRRRAERRRAWEREYDEAMQWRDWDTCDQLLEEQPPRLRP